MSGCGGCDGVYGPGICSLRFLGGVTFGHLNELDFQRDRDRDRDRE